MRTLVVILLLVVPTASFADDANPCLKFEPAVVSVVGTLVKRTYPGPPNYVSIKAGDEAETYWHVKLIEPLCVRGKAGDDLNSEDVSAVGLVQLIFLHDEYRTHAHLVRKRVKATGTLSTAISGHHHTPVVMLVTKLEAAP